MEIVIQNAQVSIVDHPALPGGKVLQFIESTGNIVTIPLSDESARKIAAGLTSGLIVANGSQLPSHLTRQEKQRSP